MNNKKQQSAQFDVKKLLENRQYVAIGATVIAALIVILVSVLALKVPVVPVCIIVLLEVGIAACLDNEQIWLHGAVLLIEIIAGILTKKIIFMILVGVVYVVALFALKYWKES
ncbi:MAG: hypothetical protein ACI4ES_16875 [Roseburia sp.]